MSKDPAYLFYDGDAAKDVSHMNRLERGAYFDILQAQRKFGRLSLEIIKKVLGQDFEKTWEAVKIVLTYVEDKCVFYVSWLEESCLKRQQYCESRRTNRLQSKIKPIKHMSNTCNTYVEHMEDENDNVIKDVIKDKNTIPPTIEMVTKYCLERGKGIDPQSFIDHYEARGWQFKTGQKMKDWQAAVRTWEKNNFQRGNNVSAGRAGDGRKNIGKPGYDADGNALGAVAKPGEFDEGVITLEGVRDH